mmetsp:Transcript_3033/g.8579  ORF Transcript_3033/g.8579 Transcript_3033/m.8579 type:complete len:86 (+) Transcript_3033:1632-1889(+)
MQSRWKPSKHTLRILRDLLELSRRSIQVRPHVNANAKKESQRYKESLRNQVAKDKQVFGAILTEEGLDFLPGDRERFQEFSNSQN